MVVSVAAGPVENLKTAALFGYSSPVIILVSLLSKLSPIVK